MALGVLGVGNVGGDELARFVLGGDGGALLGDAQDALGAEDVDVEDAGHGLAHVPEGADVVVVLDEDADGGVGVGVVAAVAGVAGP